MAIYTDLALLNPTTAALITDLSAIYQAVFALLNTRKGERLFMPDAGNSLEDSLFDLVDTISALDVLRRITADITSQITLVSVNPKTRVTPDPVNGVFNLYLVLDPVGLSNASLVFEGSLSRSAA
jgi:phage baseplate assembly protein W